MLKMFKAFLQWSKQTHYEAGEGPGEVATAEHLPLRLKHSTLQEAPRTEGKQLKIASGIPENYQIHLAPPC